ncbi:MULTISPECIES: phosphoglucosamine mutase [unclassified Lebetimonas]|uniref:phosphoglucosamine mutase n=1 Tax=unclassified Lebetimonas TaxID=2648158 RepID=UPI0004654883|nr:MULTISPECIES: phosphoglucosamine mutase [unclassified Lebetimonas]
MKLFGTDGIRGKAGEKITPFLATKIAMAFGETIEKKTGKILVGKDTRRSGYMIENGIVSGLTAIGYNVIQIGPMPTPAIAFLTEDMRCDGGIMISASHNPFYDNGIKFFDATGNKLDEKIEAKIEERYFKNDFSLKTGKEIGKSKRIDDVIGRYIVHIKSSFPKNLNLNGFRIVIDTANGAAYKVAPTIFEELGADVITINNNPNGFNINSNSGAMHPEILAEKVKEYRADVGFALDGDADRLVVVDEKGEVIDGDKLLGALAYYLHKKNKLSTNKTVVTVMSNSALDKFLNKFGIEVLRSNVGDKNVLELMKKENINFGGEQSGHIIFSDYAKTGDGLVSALQVCAYLLESSKKASEAFNLFELFPQIQANINVVEKIPLQKIDGAKALFEEIEKNGFRHLIRYSGTENKLRLLIEGENEKRAKELLNKLTEFFKSKLS